MIILTKYQIVPKDDFFCILAKEPVLCPVCHSPLQVRDSKKRSLITENGVRVFKLRRLKCPQCGKIHSEIPDCITPYKRYSRDLIERAVHGDTANCPAEDSTLYRWGRERSEL